MIYAQILYGVVVNIIVLDDSTLVPQFTMGFDFCLEIDNLAIIPQIGWSYNAALNIFYPPSQTPVDSSNPQDFIEITATTSTSTNNGTYSLLNSMTYSLFTAGSYLVQFTGTFSTNVPLFSAPGVLITIFATGIQLTASEMSQNNTASNTPFVINTSGTVTIDDYGPIAIYWKNNGAGNTITCTNRVLDITKVA